MQCRPLAFASLLPLLLAVTVGQEPAAGPLPEGVVARVDGQDILLEEYKDYLWRQTGKRLLPQLVDDRLVRAACARFGIEVDQAALEAQVEERLAQLVQGRSAEEVEKEMRERGMSFATVRENLRGEFERNARLDALVRATRVATDQRLQAVFEAEYGPGGLRIELRQILCMPHVLRAERIRAGADPAGLDQEALSAEARALAEAARARVAAGEDFAAVAAELSHDQTSKQQGGMLAAYRPGLYGADFSAAVDALAEGELSGVIHTNAGFHVVQVVSRKLTQLSAVRDELTERVMDAAPSWQEREELLAALRSRASITM